VLTMHLGPDEVLLNIEVQFTRGLTAEAIHEAVLRIEERITERYPQVTRIFIEVQALRVGTAPAPGAAGDAGA
jgi:divalent metal cation (Fe/Co/Zn/Cd) transporter